MERSAAFHRQLQAIVERFEQNPSSYALSEGAFDHLACGLARFQAETIPGFARLCAARGVDPAKLERAADIPAVPTDAFKVTRVATFPEDQARVTFQTSGTTIGARGTHAMRDPSTYRAAAVAFGRRWLARDHASLPIAVLTPSPKDMPDSSLVHMCDAFIKAFGTEGHFIIDEDEVFDLSTFDEEVANALARDQPILVLATSFALVHLLDALGDGTTFRLPRGSRVMQTGGYKGKSREVSPEELRRDLARVFAIPERSIVAEYGMTELSSQFYEQTLFEPSSRHGVFVEPPWARVVAVDPESLTPVNKEGEIGIAKIIDLMNVDSAVAILTQDRVRRCGENTFELLGRMPGAPPRGCSIVIDEILGKRLP